MTTGLAEEAITTRSTAMSATGSPRRAISSNRVPSAFDLLGERAPLGIEEGAPAATLGASARHACQRPPMRLACCPS
jgi:hypothetical protein